MAKKKTYRVYFSQINQTIYEVKAVSVDSALNEAERLWKQENSFPPTAHIEDDEGNHVY